jgi:hypothetical protein
LRERSLERIKAQKDFAYLADDVARLKKNVAEKSVSLNEAERRQELAQSKARKAKREQEEQAHPSSQPTTYEITLRNASSPGLPPPMAPKKNPAATPGTTSSSTSDDLDPAATRRSPDSDILLHETTKILADYADLLGGKSRPPQLVGPRASAPAL